MLVKIGQPVDHGFDAPPGLLSDCHRRIERFLAVLPVTTEARRGGVLEAVDRAALEAALRYFKTAAPRHSADEEESLFPRFRSAQDPETQAALETLARLEADHRSPRRTMRPWTRSDDAGWTTPACPRPKRTCSGSTS